MHGVIDNDTIRKIRENVDIVEVIGQEITLEKKGKNYFGLCPFHNDNNPSLSVSREKQIYKCFVCGEAGNVFNFLMKFHNINFKEAVLRLANEIGMDIGDKIQVKPDKNKIYYDIYDIANKFFQNNLLSSEGAKAREYLEKRHLTMETIKEFQIGLALQSRDSLTKLLTKKGYDLKTLNDLGLATNDYDSYIKRIIFPLSNINGEVNGFSGRIYNGENVNKYLNTRETPIFKKGENIYNYARAKEEVRKVKFVILMEGFMAVIRAYTIGVKNCIATMGTSLTSEQIKLIKRLTNTVYLCLDGDNAGINATINNGKLLEKENMEVKVIPLGEGLDPDDYILKYGSEKFISLISGAISYNDFKIRLLKKGVNLASASEKADYVNSVLKEVSLVKDEIKREIMLKNLAKETDIWYNTLEKKLKELLASEETAKIKAIDIQKPASKKKDKYERTMQIIIYYMLENKEVITLVENSGVYFPSDNYRILAREISYFYDKYGYINIADFMSYVSENASLNETFKEILALDLDNSVSKEVILEYLDVIKKYNVTLEIKRLEKLIMEEVDLNEQIKISDQIRKLKMGSEKND